MRIVNANAPKIAPMAPRPAARPLLGVARSSVTWGQVFRRYNADGTLGDKTYAAVGKNGRFYSINLSSADVAAADDGEARVKVVGSWDLTVKVGAKSANTNTRRDRVNDESIYKVKGGAKMYANLGKLRDGRFISLNVQSQDYALGGKGAKNVTVTGSYELTYKLAA